jgi:hypothetical protein
MANITIATGFPRARNVDGIYRQFTGIYTGPTNYQGGPAAGDPLAPGDVLMGVIEYVDVGNAFDGSANLRFITWDRVNGFIRWFTASGTEVGNGTSLAGFTAPITVFGR